MERRLVGGHCEKRGTADIVKNNFSMIGGALDGVNTRESCKGKDNIGWEKCGFCCSLGK